MSQKPRRFAVSFGGDAAVGPVPLWGSPGCRADVTSPERRPRRGSSRGAGARLGASRQSCAWQLVCSPPGSPMTALPFTTSCKNLAADLGELPGSKM